MTKGAGFCPTIFFVNVSDVIKLHDDIIHMLGGMPGLRDRRIA